jgi:hypothetical protein
LEELAIKQNRLKKFCNAEETEQEECIAYEAMRLRRSYKLVLGGMTVLFTVGLALGWIEGS